MNARVFIRHYSLVISHSLNSLSQINRVLPPLHGTEIGNAPIV
jgi:hypothetical protein